MPRYLVEVYVPAGAEALGESVARAQEAAAAMSAAGIPIRHLRATHVPEDDTCLHLFEAASPEAVDEASRRAGLSYTRIVEAVEGRES